MQPIAVSIIISLLIVIEAFASENFISDLLKNHSVLLLGEVRGKKESSNFLSGFVKDYTENGSCINIGLEISTAEQGNIEKYLQGKVNISEIRINTYVSHPGYLEMLGEFKYLIDQGRCIKVFGVDVPDTVPVEKDAWISRTINNMQGGTPLIVLLGNRFAFKTVEWTDNKIDKQLIAQRLSAEGIKVASVLQYWDSDNCSWPNFDLILPANKLSGEYLSEIYSGIAADLPQDVSKITDAIIVWNCGTLSKIDNSAGTEIKDNSDAAIDDKKPEDKDKEYQIKSETDRKKIESYIKRGYLIVGMTKDDVIKTLGEPEIKNQISDTYEKWSYECYDENGFYFECNILTFDNDILISIGSWSK